MTATLTPTDTPTDRPTPTDTGTTLLTADMLRRFDERQPHTIARTDSSRRTSTSCEARLPAA